MSKAYMPKDEDVIDLGTTAIDTKPPEGFSRWVENGKWKAAKSVSPSLYGPHDYNQASYTHLMGIGGCICGCYMGRTDSRGNVDPFGPCPMNPHT